MKTYKSCWFSSNQKFWKFLAINPFDVTWPLYTYYSIFFVGLFTVVYDVLCTINLYFLPRRIENFIAELIFYFTELAAMSKVFTFLLMKDELRQIFRILESDIFNPETKEAKKYIDEAKMFNLSYRKFFFTVSATANIIHVLSPFISHIIKGTELLLPVSSYSFLTDTLRKTYIYPLYFYQCIGMHFIMLYNVNIDTFILSLMILVIAQLKILEEKLATITEDSKSEDENTFPLDSATYEKHVISKLNKAIIHNIEVEKFCNLIEKVFSISLFAQFSMSSFIICICLFRFTMPAPWQYFVFLGTYMCAMICEIMVPSWFGTCIMEKSYQLSQAIYSCDWTPRSEQFKSSMRIFVVRANRPFAISGWKMFPLALTTFTSIMNSAYSFYTLLRHMQSR